MVLNLAISLRSAALSGLLWVVVGLGEIDVAYERLFVFCTAWCLLLDGITDGMLVRFREV